MENEEIKPIAAGDVVAVVTEDYEDRMALVTCVHGQFGGTYVPCINVVYIATDAGKRDPYGQQIERLSSLGHWSQTSGMPRPGRYWRNI